MHKNDVMSTLLGLGSASMVAMKDASSTSKPKLGVRYVSCHTPVMQFRNAVGYVHEMVEQITLCPTRLCMCWNFILFMRGFLYYCMRKSSY